MNKTCPHFLSKNSTHFDQGLKNESLKSRRIVRNGSYRRRSDSKKVERFFCRDCKVYFSRAQFSRSYRQKKRRLNPVIQKLLVSGVSQRRCAALLNINRKTVIRKFHLLAEHSKLTHQKYLIQKYNKNPIVELQFDDMETSEHTKLKPLSISIAVEPKSRKIVDFEVSRMPAKGLLSAISIKKYGVRADERPQGWDHLMNRLTQVVCSEAMITSDMNPHYVKPVRKYFPKGSHVTVKGRDACVVGQGELKKVGFDPIFSLNHTCAMVRANLNRMFRRTWCTTKTLKGLIDHLWLYVRYHNLVLTDEGSAIKGAS